MTRPVSDIAFTPAVKTVQERMGSRGGYASMEARGGWSSTITPDLTSFIAERDSFYLGTATADGRPYIQHRGGLPGFLKVLDDKTLAFADYRGNRQYISVGNLSENDQAFLFLMDYPNRRRIKIWGRAEIVEDDAGLVARLVDPDSDVQVERAFLFHVEAWDVNCPKYITPRFTAEQFEPMVRKLRGRIAELEATIAKLGGDTTERSIGDTRQIGMPTPSMPTS
jgi:predicted pyridoxine 5'-phosphate oxidase superfamily flavin-nucleotide-binding protein